MSLPVLMEPAAVAEYLGVSEDTLARWRASGTEGPASIRVGQKVCYTERAVESYITAQETGSKAATPAQIASAMQSGSAERRAAMQERTKQLQQIDADDRLPQDQQPADAYAVSMSNVGASGSFERHSTVPGMQTFGRADVTVAVQPARNGYVPQPGNR